MRKNKHIQKWLVIWLSLLVFSGCGSSQQKADITEKNDHIDTIQFKQLKEHIKDKADFILLVSRTNSPDCEIMQRTLASYFRAKPIIKAYELSLDNQGETLEDAGKAYTTLQDVIPSFSGSVPQIFYFKEGTVEKTLAGKQTEIAWQNFLIECKLISGKIIEEKTDSFKITDTGFERVDVVTAADYFRNKQQIYLYYARSDRYNEAFSKKLSKYAAKNNLKVAILYEEEIILPDGESERQAVEAAIELLNGKLNSQFSPALYHIGNGKVQAVLKDNVSVDVMSEWIDEHPFKKQ